MENRKLKIAVYAICNGEEQFVERFMKSCEDADEIVIGNTGCKDRACEIFAELGARVLPVHIKPWRFDHSRNAVLAAVSPDIDVCISLDVDEILTAGWRQKIEDVWEKGVTNNLWYKFDWGHGIVFPYHKIHSRDGWHWHHACHEDLRLDARMKLECKWISDVLVEHYPDPTKSRGSYMEILAASVKEDPHDPTHYFYYARELWAYRRYDEAITALEHYLGMNAASNQNERCYAQRLLSSAWMAKGDMAKAEKWAVAAANEAPNTREPWNLLAELAYKQHRWWECLAYAQRCLAIKNKLEVYTMDPAVWGGQPHDYVAISAFHLNLKDLALEHGKLAAELEPNNERFKNNLPYYEQMGE